MLGRSLGFALLSSTLAVACIPDTGDGAEFGGLTIGADDDGLDRDGIDDRPVVRAEIAPPPISGGTLLVAKDGDTVIAADSDRDVVHVVSLAQGIPLATVALEPGDEPGRVAQDDDGIVHVVLRGGAAIAAIDPRAGSVVARYETCANPRGLAFDAKSDTVVVACAGGELVEHAPDGAVRSRRRIATDLRDVIVRDDVVQTTRFRSSEVLTVDRDGAVLETLAPPPSPNARVAGIAWRTRATPDGGWLMVHQAAVTRPLETGQSIFRSGTYGGSGGSGPSTSGGAPPLFGCDGPVAGVLTMRRPDGTLVGSELLTFATLPVDVAISPDGEQIAVAIAGQHDEGSETMERQRGLVLVEAARLVAEPDSDCHDGEDVLLDGQLVAVEFVDDDTIVAQSREPAGLFVYELADRGARAIWLPGASAFDTGHDLFHQDAGAGLSCASCHPEGGDDGHVWLFAPEPLARRTQSLQIGVGGTEPFHWSGDLADFEVLTQEIHATRMGAAQQTDDRVAAFADWVFAIPPPRPERAPDDELAARGRAAFVAVGCAECHTDDALVTGKTAEVLGKTLQIPSLVGVALRPPYMHDGRYTDLASAVTGMLYETDPYATLAPEDTEAIVAYLETL